MGCAVKFRITASQIFEMMQARVFPGEQDTCDAIAEGVNDLLGAEEAKCHRLYGDCIGGVPTKYYIASEPSELPYVTHTALLWNVEKIEGIEK